MLDRLEDAAGVVVAETASALMTPTTADLAEVIERSAQEHAEQLVAEGVGRITADIVVEREIVRGEPGSALASAARATRDLLVVGSRRYGPVRSVLVGTVGHHLAAQRDLPRAHRAARRRDRPGGRGAGRLGLAELNRPAGPDRRASPLSGPGEDHRPSRNGGYSSRMSAT